VDISFSLPEKERKGVVMNVKKILQNKERHIENNLDGSPCHEGIGMEVTKTESESQRPNFYRILIIR
jgi:hypothetical protein